MKYLRLVFLSLLLFSYNSYSKAATAAPEDFCNIVNTSFKSGEVLNFRVYYNMGALWVHAGDASFTTTMKNFHGQQAFHVVGEGKTKKSYEWFYKVHDIYETYIDANTMLPFKFLRNVNEGGMKFTNNVSFNHAQGKATSTNGTFNIPQCTQDVLSAIYFARNIDFSKYKPGDKIPFSMFLDDEVHKLYIRYVGKDKITTKYGTFNAIKISPLLIEGTLFKGGEKMMIWVSDDANHIPLRIDSPILVGSIKVDLIGYSNIRNPFTSIIKTKK